MSELGAGDLVLTSSREGGGLGVERVVVNQHVKSTFDSPLIQACNHPCSHPCNRTCNHHVTSTSRAPSTYFDSTSDSPPDPAASLW